MDFKYEMVTPNDDLFFRLFVFEGKDGDYHVEKHWHRSIELFVVLEGEITFYINNTKYQLEEEKMIVVNTNQIHSIDAKYRNRTLVLQIPKELLRSYIKEDEILFKPYDLYADQKIICLIKEMYTYYERKEKGYAFKVIGMFYEVLYLLQTFYQLEEVDERIKEQNKQLEKLSTITNYIKNHYKEELTLEGVASEFGFNPAYLSRMFHQYTGINYKSYLTHIRVSEAFKQLMNTNYSIMRIATENGFSDSRSFSKAFKKRFGTIPSTYRKEKVK